MGLLVLAGCGRFAFDPLVARDDASSDGRPIDVRPLDAMLPPGLVAWYPMDDSPDNTADVVGGVNGACTAFECPLQTTGHHGGAFAFDATDNCIQVPDLGQLSLVQYTLAIWVRQDAQDNCSAIAKRVDVSGNVLNSWQIETDTSGAISAHMNDGSTSNSVTASPPAAIVNGVWQHAAIVVGGGTRTLYLDGANVASSLWPNTNYDTHPMLIGCDDNGTAFGLHWDGALDDLQIYNRALAQDEVVMLATQ